MALRTSVPKRVLDTESLVLHNSSDSEIAQPFRYAILSHRWRKREISFQDVEALNSHQKASADRSRAVEKIKLACQKARERNLRWLWVDTCCINKSDAVEETSSINAMFQWYENAEMCITYLDDVTSSTSSQSVFKRNSEFGGDGNLESEWFERGWTLQELLAPRSMEFYDSQWKSMGTRESLVEELHRVTRIASRYLMDSTNRIEGLLAASTATKLSWMAGRTTGLVEDIAYSMLGLLNVGLTPRYGEGHQAFLRLQREMIQTSTDESIFAWTVPETGFKCYQHRNGIAPRWEPPNDRWGLLAPSPDCFRDSGDVVVLADKIVPRPGSGYQWTNQGICFTLAFKDRKNFWGISKNEMDLPLNCWMYNDKGKPETVVLKVVAVGDTWLRNLEGEERLSSKKRAKPGNNQTFGLDQSITSQITISQPKLPRSLVGEEE